MYVHTNQSWFRVARDVSRDLLGLKGNEQRDPVLQKIYEKHYQTWWGGWQWWADKKVSGKFLNPRDRINKGCKDMPEVKNCYIK